MKSRVLASQFTTHKNHIYESHRPDNAIENQLRNDILASVILNCGQALNRSMSR
jgi:hypothetical protein